MDMQPIVAKKLIIVEGKDDYYVIEKIAEYLRITQIQILDCLGKGEMPEVIKSVKQTSGFETTVETMGIVRDADEDATVAFDSICGALKEAVFDEPRKPLEITGGEPKIIVLIWPHMRKKGNLEDVCLESVNGSQEIECVNEYFDCLKRKGVREPKNISKAKAQAFLASKYEACPHIGIGALKEYWPFDSKAFEPLRDFMNKL